MMGRGLIPARRRHPGAVAGLVLSLARPPSFGYDGPALNRADAAPDARLYVDRRAFMAIVAGGLLAMSLDAEAQRLLYYTGTVQWIAGSTMIVATDEGWSLRVDLTRVPLSEYSGLTIRDRIIVTGLLSQDGNYLVGTSIQRARLDYQAP